MPHRHLKVHTGAQKGSSRRPGLAAAGAGEMPPTRPGGPASLRAGAGRTRGAPCTVPALPSPTPRGGVSWEDSQPSSPPREHRFSSHWSLFSREEGCFSKEEDGFKPSLPGRPRAACPRAPRCPPYLSSPRLTRARQVRNKMILIKRIKTWGEKWIINSSCALRPNNK